MVRIISIDGGGYLGLATASFIAEVERHFKISLHEHFDLFCGTSTGAIITLALASGMSGKEIVELYKKFGVAVFTNKFHGQRILRNIAGLLVAKYSNEGLQQALNEAFNEKTLGDLKRNNKKVLITSFSVTNGKPRIFKTDHSPDLTRDDNYLLSQIALASSAAPTYLPVVELKCPNSGIKEKFCDGGVFSNNPALLGYSEAISHLGAKTEDVCILSLSTPRSNLSEPSSIFFMKQILSRGILPWASKLASVFIDSNSIVVDETLRRILNWPSERQPRYVRIKLDQPQGTGLDIVTIGATEALEQKGCDHACQTEIRNKLFPFFNRN